VSSRVANLVFIGGLAATLAALLMLVNAWVLLLLIGLGAMFVSVMEAKT
jgi:hypothetical protein